MKNKIKVLNFPCFPSANACFLYRNDNPFAYSDKIEIKTAYSISEFVSINKETGERKKHINQEFLQWADVCLFNRRYTKDKLPLMKHIIDNCKYHKIPIVYELDDLLHQNQYNIANQNIFDKYIGEDHLATTDYILQNIDCMTVSTQPLADYYSKLTDKPIHVLPNYYNPKHWDIKPTVKRKSKKFRIGWTGGKNHYQKNFSILVEPLNYLAKKYRKEIELVVFCQSNPNQDWYEGHINPFEFEFEWHRAEYVHDYPQALMNLHLDLGLIVVEDNVFSQAKSNIKWMEYGLCGIPSVASDITPYQDTTALLVKNKTKDWIAGIEYLMTNKTKYGIIKQETIKKVKSYNVRKHFRNWEKVYELVSRGRVRQESMGK